MKPMKSFVLRPSYCPDFTIHSMQTEADKTWVVGRPGDVATTDRIHPFFTREQTFVTMLLKL